MIKSGLEDSSSRAEKKEIFRKLSKEDLMRRVVIPYFTSHGWDVKDLRREGDTTHGCDLILKSTVLGERVFEGVRVETEKDISSSFEVRRDIGLYAESALKFRYGSEGVRLHKYFWITTGEITPAGHDSFRKELESSLGRIEIWDVDILHDKLLSTDIIDQLCSMRITDERRLRIFLSYASEDDVIVEDISRKLSDDGFAPWRDKEDLFVGRKWEYGIRKAMMNSDAIIVFLSKHSIDKRGYFQKEIALACDLRDHQPLGATFLLPVKLDDVNLDPVHPLAEHHWAELYSGQGYHSIVRSLKQREQELRTHGKL